MSKSRLWMGEESAEIHDADESKFVAIGEILREEIPPLRVEPYRMTDPGTWFFVIKGDFNKALECFEGNQRRRIFRVVRGDGSTVSTNGSIQKLKPPNGDVFEVTIRASEERILKPASLSS